LIAIHDESNYFEDKLWFLDGASPMADQFDPAYKASVQCNNLMHYWILSSVILDVEI